MQKTNSDMLLEARLDDMMMEKIEHEQQSTDTQDNILRQERQDS